MESHIPEGGQLQPQELVRGDFITIDARPGHELDNPALFGQLTVAEISMGGVDHLQIDPQTLHILRVTDTKNPDFQDLYDRARNQDLPVSDFVIAVTDKDSDRVLAATFLPVKDPEGSDNMRPVSVIGRDGTLRWLDVRSDQVQRRGTPFNGSVSRKQLSIHVEADKLRVLVETETSNTSVMARAVEVDRFDAPAAGELPAPVNEGSDSAPEQLTSAQQKAVEEVGEIAIGGVQDSAEAAKAPEIKLAHDQMKKFSQYLHGPVDEDQAFQALDSALVGMDWLASQDGGDPTAGKVAVIAAAFGSLVRNPALLHGTIGEDLAGRLRREFSMAPEDVTIIKDIMRDFSRMGSNPNYAGNIIDRGLGYIRFQKNQGREVDLLTVAMRAGLIGAAMGSNLRNDLLRGLQENRPVH